MHTFSRREWLVAAACWSEVLRAQNSVSLDPSLAAEIESLSDTILPGARDAGVIHFIQGALGGFDQDRRTEYQTGISDLQTRRAALFPGTTTIAGLSEPQRIQLVTSIEKTEFFTLVRRHTILGFFGHPRHGGNRNGASARLLGIQDTMMYSPPFGYYDREVAK